MGLLVPKLLRPNWFGAWYWTRSKVSTGVVMKARDLVNQLQQHDPDEEVIALVWYKDSFDYSDDEEVILTNEAWKKIVAEMEEQGGIDSGDQQISETISEMASEYAEPKEAN